jgi:hypothetical protein
MNSLKESRKNSIDQEIVKNSILSNFVKQRNQNSTQANSLSNQKNNTHLNSISKNNLCGSLNNLISKSKVSSINTTTTTPSSAKSDQSKQFNYINKNILKGSFVTVNTINITPSNKINNKLASKSNNPSLSNLSSNKEIGLFSNTQTSNKTELESNNNTNNSKKINNKSNTSNKQNSKSKNICIQLFNNNMKYNSDKKIGDFVKHDKEVDKKITKNNNEDLNQIYQIENQNLLNHINKGQIVSNTKDFEVTNTVNKIIKSENKKSVVQEIFKSNKGKQDSSIKDKIKNDKSMLYLCK